jgi:two-component system, sensor histidine kinase RegB
VSQFDGRQESGLIMFAGSAIMKFRLVATPIDSIRTLFWLRNLAVAGQLIAIWVVEHQLHVVLPLKPLLITVLALVCFNVATGLRLRARLRATQLEVSFQLGVDMLVLGVLLYFSGGATNPFVSLYLLPVAIAAIALPAAYAWSIVVLAIAAYSCLMVWFVPLDYLGENMRGMFSLHVGGMWVNFIISALLMSGFLLVMSGVVRKRDRELAGMRETSLRNEHLNAVGALAAGAAHELGTPLATMSVLVGELRAAAGEDVELRANLELLTDQIRLCKDKLSEMLEASGQPRSDALSSIELRTFLENVFDRWRLMRPAVSAQIDWQKTFVDHRIINDQGLAQTLISLLNNAADASQENGESRVSVSVNSDGGTLWVNIADEGAGLDESERARLGEAFFTTKADGWGLGLAISNANLERLQGEIVLKTRAGRGISTEMKLPLAALKLLQTESA